MASGQEIRRPQVRRVGSWKKRGRDSRSSVKRCFQEEKGGDWAGEQMWQLGHLSFSMRSWENLVFFKYPWGWEDQASTRVRLRAARRVLGLPGTDFGCHFRPSTHYFRPTLSLRGARQASGPAKLIDVEGKDFFSGSAAVAAGHLVSADPARRVSPWRERAPRRRV